jgi:hypothetical protein
MNQIILNCEGYTYILNTLPDEHIDEAYNRLWRIIQHLKTSGITSYTFDQLVAISKMWYYKQRLNCTYSSNNEKLLTSF